MESGESEDNDPDRQRIGCQYPHHGVPPEGYDLMQVLWGFEQQRKRYMIPL